MYSSSRVYPPDGRTWSDLGTKPVLTIFPHAKNARFPDLFETTRVPDATRHFLRYLTFTPSFIIFNLSINSIATAPRSSCTQRISLSPLHRVREVIRKTFDRTNSVRSLLSKWIIIMRIERTAINPLGGTAELDASNIIYRA